jgi:molecular chaperone GrpE
MPTVAGHPAPETVPEPAAADPAPDLGDLLKKAEAEVADLKNAWLRARADVENARKQAQSDVARAHKYAI